MLRKAHLLIDPFPISATIDFAVCPIMAKFNKLRSEISKTKILYWADRFARMRFISLRSTLFLSTHLLSTI